MHVDTFLWQYFLPAPLWVITRFLTEEFIALGGHGLPFGPYTYLYAHTPSSLISILSGNYSDVCLLLVIVQGKEKVNWGVWVIDWKQGIICQSSHRPEISATVQTHRPYHGFSAHVLFWKHKGLLIAFSN